MVPTRRRPLIRRHTPGASEIVLTISSKTSFALYLQRLHAKGWRIKTIGFTLGSWTHTPAPQNLSPLVHARRASGRIEHHLGDRDHRLPARVAVCERRELYLGSRVRGCCRVSSALAWAHVHCGCACGLFLFVDWPSICWRTASRWRDVPCCPQLGGGANGGGWIVSGCERSGSG